jgi:hypothetical protein
MINFKITCTVHNAPAIPADRNILPDIDFDYQTNVFSLTDDNLYCTGDVSRDNWEHEFVIEA